MKQKKIICLIVLFWLSGYLPAQDKAVPFSKELYAFKQQDSVRFPPKKAILFIGSSSFTKWTDVADYFPRYRIVNRGFGGSSLPDLIQNIEQIVFPYQPKQIVIYCGENDLASSDTITSKIVFNRFKQLFQLIRVKLPAVPIAFVSLKPSPSRQKLWPKMEEVNLMVKNYLKTKRNTAFIDVYHGMFNKDGTVMQELFVEDNLHMNKKGYAIWQQKIKPYLLK
ncbi:MAG: GDSL-type esterase/lipase family protein [Ferruginibacter sp.]